MPISVIQEGNTGIMWASRRGHTAVVGVLLLNSADANIQDKVKNLY